MNFLQRLKSLLYLSPVAMNKQQKIQFAVFMASLIFLGTILPYKFTVSITKSLDHRVYYISRNPSIAEMRKGDYGVFFIRSKYFKNGEPIRLIKQIACDEGETVVEVNRHYYCFTHTQGHTVEQLKDMLIKGAPQVARLNPQYIGKAKEYSLRGDPLEKFDFSGVIPPGKCFMAGHHKDSFDSRYWGLLDKKEFKAKAYPVF